MKVASSNKLVREAVLVGSSGDPELDEPAEIFPDGEKHWWKNGKLHRDGNFPAAIFLQKISDEELLLRFFIGALWAFFFFLLSRVILYFGLRKYSAYGA